MLKCADRHQQNLLARFGNPHHHAGFLVPHVVFLHGPEAQGVHGGAVRSSCQPSSVMDSMRSDSLTSTNPEGALLPSPPAGCGRSVDHRHKRAEVAATAAAIPPPTMVLSSHLPEEIGTTFSASGPGEFVDHRLDFHAGRPRSMPAASGGRGWFRSGSGACMAVLLHAAQFVRQLFQVRSGSAKRPCSAKSRGFPKSAKMSVRPRISSPPPRAVSG